MPPGLVWTLVGALLFFGLLGSVLPVLPGAPLVLGAAVLLELCLPEYLSGWTIAVLAVLTLLSFVLDAVLTALGGRAFGGGKWGFLGAALGGLFGLLGGPPGVLVSAIIGAVLGEALLAKKELPQAVLAGLGSGIGLVAGTAAKAFLCVCMIGLFLADCFIF